MNIYDKKILKCTICKKSIGEIDYDAHVILPQCSECFDPKPYDEFKQYNKLTIEA